jgi:hypothetical protein
VKPDCALVGNGSGVELLDEAKDANPRVLIAIPHAPLKGRSATEQWQERKVHI